LRKKGEKTAVYAAFSPKILQKNFSENMLALPSFAAGFSL